MLLILAMVAAAVLAVTPPWDDGGSAEEPAPESGAAVQGSAAPAPAAPAPKCSLATAGSPVELILPGCTTLLADTADHADPEPVWGRVDCEEESRQSWVTTGGDTHPQTTGEPQPDEAFRQLMVIDGDDIEGERCELGLNDHQEGPTAIYHEGERRVTFLSVRLPADFPLTDDVFQVVMQMKQAQPSDNGGGTPVLALEAFDGDWILRQSDSTGDSSDAHELWSAPVQTGLWTRFAFDVTYSHDPAVGRVTVYADLNGNGDFAGAGEASETFETFTLKTETGGDGSGDGLAEGDPIPSHLRVGLYHDDAYPCPAPTGCRVDLDNVQVVAP